MYIDKNWRSVMDKKATESYIKNSTGMEINDLMNALYWHDEYYLTAVEAVLDNKDVYRYVWNNLYLPYEVAHERVINYEEFNTYPRFKEFLKARLDAYYKIDDGEYVHKEFSSERLQYIPAYKMKDREIALKLDDEDWKLFFINKKLYEEAADDPFGFLKNNINNFCIIDKETKGQVGIIHINASYPTKRDWSVSYIIAKEYRGRGYAQETVKAVIQMVKNKHLFGIIKTRYSDVYKKNNNCKSIIGTTFDSNIKSQNVLERCGFQRTTQFNVDDCVTYIYTIK